jgi:anti-sigma regulatory factor (Ser/Thr protein kinase)
MSADPCLLRDLSFEVPATEAAVGEARRRVVGVVRAWHLPFGEDGVQDLALCFSEVLGSAVRHGGGPCSVRVHVTGDTLRTEVSDGSTSLPHQAAPPDDAENGRGLLLVATLTARWGTYPSGPGKTVWFEQLLHPTPPPSPNTPLP